MTNDRPYTHMIPKLFKHSNSTESIVINKESQVKDQLKQIKTWKPVLERNLRCILFRNRKKKRIFDKAVNRIESKLDIVHYVRSQNLFHSVYKHLFTNLE